MDSIQTSNQVPNQTPKNSNSKIIWSVIVLAVVIFFALKLFNKNEVCPPDKCTYQTGPGSQISDIAFSQEEGRVRQDFLASLPVGLPIDMPIDKKPLKLISSYVETVTDKEQGDSYKQITYQYTTGQKAVIISGDFERYLKDNGYSVSINKGNFDLLTYTLSGNKAKESITISVATQSQFESNVSISVIVSDTINNLNKM